MRFLGNAFKIAWQRNAFVETQRLAPAINLVHVRNLRDVREKLRGSVDVEWKPPEFRRYYDPVKTGDLEPMEQMDQSLPKLEFQDSEEWQMANDDVKKIFSLGYQMPVLSYLVYRKKLVDKVKQHEYDDNSLEVRIAEMTARIRYLQNYLANSLKERKKYKVRYHKELKIIIKKRKDFLTLLRSQDYRRFEWLLEKLNIAYKVDPAICDKMTRKQSLTSLITLQAERQKEEKLAKYKKELDDQKIPFLEKKLKNLRWMKEQEETFNLAKTVTDKDIEDCIKQIEDVKLELQEKQKKSYVRKIHPFFLVPYYPKEVTPAKREEN